MATNNIERMINELREQNLTIIAQINDIKEKLDATIEAQNQLGFSAEKIREEISQVGRRVEQVLMVPNTDTPKTTRTRKTASDNKKTTRNKKAIVEKEENDEVVEEGDVDEVVLSETKEKKKRAPAKKNTDNTEEKEKKKRAPAKKKEPAEKKKRQTKAEKEASKIATDVIDLQMAVNDAEDS